MSTSHRVTFAALFLAGVLCAVTLFVGRETPDVVPPGPERPSDEIFREVGAAPLESVADRIDGGRDERPAESAARTPIDVEPRPMRTSASEPRARMVAPTTVRVVDELGAAVPGARVGAELLRESGPRVRVARAATDALGVATIDAAGARRVNLTVTPAADDFVHADREIELDVAPELLVRLATRHWLELAVVDAAGRPVADVDGIELERERGSGMPAARRSDGANGVHRVDVGDAPGVARVRSTRVGVGKHAFDPAQPSTMRGTVRLARPSSIDAVTTRDGRAIAGVRVALVDRVAPERLTVGRVVLGFGVGSTERFHGEQTSDAAGRVSFAIHEFREYVLVAEAQGVGACELAVRVDRADPGIEIALELTRGNSVAVSVAGSGARRVPISLFGPAGTRRGDLVAPGTTFVADGLPRGRYLASAGWTPLESGRHFALDGDERSVLELSSRPRCRLEVPGERGVELYATTTPARRVPETEQRFVGAVVFVSDDPGPHLLVQRQGGARGSVHVLPFELNAGPQFRPLDAPKPDATFELVASKSFDERLHRWRPAPHDGWQSYYALRSDVLVDAESGKRVEGRGWSAVVPSGTGDLVRIDPRSGDVEVVVGGLVLDRGAARRVVLEDQGK